MFVAALIGSNGQIKYILSEEEDLSLLLEYFEEDGVFIDPITLTSPASNGEYIRIYQK